MGSVVVNVLSITIGLFFILVGTIKLSPIINEDIYKDMRKTFIKLVKTLPLLSLMGLKLSPHMYRKIVGVTEIICGLILAFIPGRLKQVANVVLIASASLDLYTHYRAGDTMEKMTSSLVFGMLLLCRFIVRIQVQIRENREKKELEKAAESVAAAVGKNGSYRPQQPSKAAAHHAETRQPAAASAATPPNPKEKKSQ